MNEPAGERWRLTARVHGRVQGVGYRFFVRRQASALGLSGYVRNLPDRDVEVIAEGSRRSLEQLRRELERGPIGAEVDTVDTSWSAAQGAFGTFQIRQ